MKNLIATISLFMFATSVQSEPGFAKFQGIWAPTKDKCEFAGEDPRILIDQKSIKRHEESCIIVSRKALGQSMQIKARCDGEGETWQYTANLTISIDGRMFYDKKDGGTGLYVRCPFQSLIKQKSQKNWIEVAKIDRALLDQNSSYGDIRSSIDCNNPKVTSEKIICSSSYLKKAELLSIILSAYDTENATKSEVDRKTFRGPLPKSCEDENCVYKFFEIITNNSLGARSPYRN